MNSPILPSRASGHWPAPQVLNVPDAQRLVHRLGAGRSGGTVVQLLAAGTGEGTSTLVRDLALVAARLPGLRVLLLDGDSPGDKQLTVLREAYGLAALGSDQVGPGDVAIHRLALGGLHVSEARLPPGAGAPVLLGLLPALQDRFDLVLIDSPAIDRSYDGIMLAPAIDTSLLVIEAEKTRSAVAQTVRDRILDVGGVVAGVVFNKQRYYLPGFIYRHV